MLYLDLPTAEDLADLARRRADIAVSIYLPTTPVSTETAADRIMLKNLARDAASQLETAGADKRRIATLVSEIDDVIDDASFWRYQARGLVILATPDNLRAFRVATALEPSVEVSDRFHLKPLMRTMNYFDACYVLALAEGGVRLIEVPADLPAGVVDVPGLPASADDVGRGTSLDEADRSAGGEAHRVRLRHYCRQIDSALRSLLSGGTVPLIVASVARIGNIYRSINTYPYLASDGIDGNPERRTPTDLAADARVILDRLHDGRIRDWHELYRQRLNADRATSDLGRAARAATYGAVQSLLVDMERTVEGTIDDDGVLSLADAPHTGTYAVTDEIARRVLLTGGEVLSVRGDEVPADDSPLAAVLRYAI